MNRQTVSITTKQAAGEDLRTFTISTRSSDREGDILEPAGVVLDNYRKNPIVLWSHAYNALPIGQSLRIGPVGNLRIEADVKFAPTEFAQQVKILVDQGFIRTASVGFRSLAPAEPLDTGGYRYTSWELLEWSIVNVPANAEALILAAKSKGLKVDAIERAGQRNPLPWIHLPEEAGGGVITLEYLGKIVREITQDLIAKARGR